MPVLACGPPLPLTLLPLLRSLLLLLLQVRFIGGNHVTSHELLSFNMVWLGLQVTHTLQLRG
jgi:EamA domain-containing membrane protein RarD